MNKELHELYDYTQTVVEKYKDIPKDKASDKEFIALIFDEYLSEEFKEKRAQNLIKGMLIYQFHYVEGKAKEDANEVQNKILNFISLLLQNDPSIYSQLMHAFWKLREEPNGISDVKLCQCKEKIDKLQVAIKLKECKTPFYNVMQGKYDGPYLTFNFDDPVIKQKAETVIFPKLQQILKEKYGDQVEAELRSNGQIWLKKWSDIPLGAVDINIMVNQISMKE